MNPGSSSLILTDTATRHSRTLNGTDSKHGVEWSPGGTKLLFVDESITRAEPDLSVALGIYDVASDSIQVIRLKRAEFGSVLLQAGWYPDGQHIVVAISGPGPHTDGADDVDHFQVIDLNGARTSTVAARIEVPPAHAWSPDRRHVIGCGTTTVDGGVTKRMTEQCQLIDTATGQPVANLANVQDAWWIDNSHALIEHATGASDTSITLTVVDLHGSPQKSTSLGRRLPRGYPVKLTLSLRH